MLENIRKGQRKEVKWEKDRVLVFGFRFDALNLVVVLICVNQGFFFPTKMYKLLSKITNKETSTTWFCSSMLYM